MNIANDCGSGHNRFRRSQEIWNRGQLDQQMQISLGHGCRVLQALAPVRWDDDACIREWHSPKNALTGRPQKLDATPLHSSVLSLTPVLQTVTQCIG